MESQYQYVFQHLISTEGYRQNIYKYNDIFIATLTVYNTSEDFRVDMYISLDEGITWERDEDLPVPDYLITDVKCVVANGTYYLFGHGLSSAGVDCIYYIKKNYSETDDVMTWDESWSRLHETTPYNNRITDIKVDEAEAFIHIVYDQYMGDSIYNVKYAMFSVTNQTLTYDVNIYPSPYNQNNAHLVMMDNYIVAFAWDQNNANGVKQIWCAEFSILQNQWLYRLEVSTDKFHNDYHVSIARDSENTIHLTWLNTQDNYKTDNIKYGIVINNEVKQISTITSKAQANHYPLMLCDSNDKLYILYNSSSNNIEYYTKYVNDFLWTTNNQWKNVNYLHDNTWQWTNGICDDNNIFTIVNSGIDNSNTDIGLYLIRIDTTEVEDGNQIRNLQITSLDNTYMNISWTGTKNAETITLQCLQKDSWNKANIANDNGTDVITETTSQTNIVNLDEGKYKVRIAYTDVNNDIHYIYLPDVYEIVNYDGVKENISIEWIPSQDAITQYVEFCKETWLDYATINRTSTEAKINITSLITSEDVDDMPKFRLRVVGGYADGVSNIIQPLKMFYDSQGIAKINWMGIESDTIILQQSLDGNEWYNTNIPVNNEQTTAIINNHDVYRYRLQFIQDDLILYSNSTSMVTDLHAIVIEHNYIQLHWTSTNATEIVQCQYSTDVSNNYNDIDWKTTNLPVSNSTMILKGLDYDTTYSIRLKYPSRLTGRYSNIINITTAKKPISDLKCTAVVNNNVSCQFTIDEEFDDVNIYVVNNVLDNTTLYKLTDCQHQISTTTNAKTKVVTFTLSLNYGVKYSISVEPINSRYGNLSKAIAVQTLGASVPTISLISTTAHSITFSWDSLGNFTEELCEGYLSLSYSDDGEITWTDIDINQLNNNTFTLDNICQNTQYSLQLWCGYGDNYGLSDSLIAKTLTDNFEAIQGYRIPLERCSVIINNLIYIYDKGRIYTYDTETKEQVFAYRLQVNNEYLDDDVNNIIFADMVVDKNNCIHLVCATDCKILYFTNCKHKDGNYQLSEAKVIYNNNLVNRCLNVDLAIDKSNNMLYITWENDFGNYSDVMFAQYKNADCILEPQTLISNQGYNHMPKIALTTDGWYMCCIYNEIYLVVVNNKINNDYTNASDYLQYSMTTDILELENPCNDIFNNFNILVDNIDTLRIFYDSYTDGEKTSTYAIYTKKGGSDGKIEVQNIFSSGLSDVVMYSTLSDLIIVGREGTIVSTSRLIDDRFSNPLTLQDNIEDKPLLSCSDDNNVYIISVKAGLWNIISKPVSEIRDENNYVDGLWIDNKFSVQNDEDDYVADIWTNDNINQYPSLYLKCNNIVKDITPLDELGEKMYQTIIVNDFNYVDISDEQYSSYINNNTKAMLKIDFNDDKMLIIDITNWLYYSWDVNNIINSASK